MYTTIISDEPEFAARGLVSPVGADFCISLDAAEPILTLRCDILVEDTFVFPTPTRAWYKDGYLVYRVVDGDVPSIDEDFYLRGNNSILTPGLSVPEPLVALPDGSLILSWAVLNASAPQILPGGADLDSLHAEVFRRLLGSWECEVSNSLGGGNAETVLTDCGEHLLMTM